MVTKHSHSLWWWMRLERLEESERPLLRVLLEQGHKALEDHLDRVVATANRVMEKVQDDHNWMEVKEIVIAEVVCPIVELMEEPPPLTRGEERMLEVFREKHHPDNADPTNGTTG